MLWREWDRDRGTVDEGSGREDGVVAIGDAQTQVKSDRRLDWTRKSRTVEGVGKE